MPQQYQWNNGAPYWNTQVAPDPPRLSGDHWSEDQHVVRTGLWDELDGPSQGKVLSHEQAAHAHQNEVRAKDGEEEKLPARKSTGRNGFNRFVRAVTFRKQSVPEEVDAGTELPGNNAASTTGDGPTASGSQTTMSGSDSVVSKGSGDAGGETQGKMALENSAQLPRELFYTDPYLSELIQQALYGNQELRILNEEIQIARNEAYAASGEYRPFVSLGASAGLEKSGRHTREGAVEEQLEVAPDKGFPDPLPDFLTAANVSWELDIWNRLRNAQRAAAMRYLASQEGRNYIVTRLVADLAENYFNLLALDARAQNLDNTIAIQQLSLKVAEANKEAGRGTELAVRRFEAEVRKNQSEKAIIAQEIVETENRINFLVGRFPQPVDRPTVDFIDLHLDALSAGVPSQLLQNRADIREAEREVAAAGLDVQVARARFYPSLTLTGGLGWNAFTTGYLFRTPESLIYSVAAEMVGPLINKRAIQAAYSSANATQLQRIYDYQQTVLTAHIEVVNFMTKIENYRRSIEAKKQQLESLEASVDSATKLFQNARVEYVEVLLAQREYMEAKMMLINVKREQLEAITSAYQALGGGF